MGNKEIKKAGEYTQREKHYVQSLLQCRAALNKVNTLYFELLNNTNEENINHLAEEITNFRNQVNFLLCSEKNQKKRSFLNDRELRSYMACLYSAVLTLKKDLKAPCPERQLLLKDDFSFISREITLITKEVQERLNIELDHVENWRNQSLFFFQKLEINLVYYFILTTLFTFISFIISGIFLKKYLTIISKGAQEIRFGNLDYRFNDTTNDIIGTVMRDFDSMTEKLSTQTLELKKINTELNKKAQELQEVNEHKDQFLANMSHELRTPLNSIIGFSDLMIANAEKYPPEKVKAYSEKILKAAEHLLELISDLLEVAKINAGVLKLEPAEFDLNSLCRNVIEMLQPIAAKKNLQLKIELKNDSIPISADRRLLKQALINLINNAIKFTAKGFVKLTAYTEGDEIRIRIEDTGIGISKKDHHKIFKNFHRVEQGLTSNYEGVGLGLTLTQKIVELHQGRITLNSELNKGSIFTVIFPKLPENEVSK
jgi:signal transduction histidine kinase